MAQRATPAQTPEIETNATEAAVVCRHHWVIQPADGPISKGSCQVCGETREFKNYVESATWGDSRTSGKDSSASATKESPSKDEEMVAKDMADHEPEPDIEPNDSDPETED